MMKKFIAVVVTVAMTIGSAIMVNAEMFYDINDAPWEGAKEYINNVSSLNLMVGDTDSSNHTVFRPKDRVTYCEAMQIVYSILKNTDTMESTDNSVEKWKESMQKAYIPEWAYPCVAYGLENGVLLESDIPVFMKSEGINRNATRENVSVIFGKAIEHLSSVNKSATLNFNDKDEVTGTSVPYIELLSRLSIIVGDDSDNFNPKNYINRSEMAVIASKTYYKIEEIKVKSIPEISESISGTVMLTDDTAASRTIAISANEEGTVSTYKILSDTPVSDDEGYKKTYTDITIGDIVTIETINGEATSVVINYDNEVM